MSISKILQGIDRCEVDHTDGWWETSTGAAFGRLKLVEAQGYEFGLLSRIEALTQELVDAKQAARYETDVAQQAIADFEEAKGKIEALEKDAARLDFIGYHGLLCLDSVSNKAGGNGQKQVAATRCNIDAAIAGEAT